MKFRVLPLVFVFSFITACSRQWLVHNYNASNTEINSAVIAEDSIALTAIAPYKAKMEEAMNEVLNTSELALIKDQPEGLLGNFVADLVLKKAREVHPGKIDICLLNNGGLRTALPKGEITRGKIYELMPFENTLTVITLEGKKLGLMFDYLAQTGGAPVAGVKMGINNSAAVNIFIDGEAFDSTKSYTVVTSDYLANGGDKYHFFKEPLQRINLKIKVRDAILEFVTNEKKQGRTLTSSFDGRIHYVH